VNEEQSWTYSVTRLLNKDLSEPDHLGIIVELFGKVDHGIGRVLLFTRTSSGKKGTSSSNCNFVAISSPSGCILHRKWNEKL